jgi:hypothetical protein
MRPGCNDPDIVIVTDLGKSIPEAQKLFSRYLGRIDRQSGDFDLRLQELVHQPVAELPAGGFHERLR